MISITRTLSGIKLASSQMFKSAIVPIHDRAGSYIVIKNGGLHFQNTRTRCNEIFWFSYLFSSAAEPSQEVTTRNVFYDQEHFLFKRAASNHRYNVLM